MRAVDPNAQPEVQRVLDYLTEIRGTKILLGQHTQTMGQEELNCIKEITGQLPAVCGFELLGYSPNIRPELSGEECMTEVNEARGTLRCRRNGHYSGHTRTDGTQDTMVLVYDMVKGFHLHGKVHQL